MLYYATQYCLTYKTVPPYFLDDSCSANWRKQNGSTTSDFFWVGESLADDDIFEIRSALLNNGCFVLVWRDSDDSDDKENDDDDWNANKDTNVLIIAFIRILLASFVFLCLLVYQWQLPCL
jgi:hypothetical protein